MPHWQLGLVDGPSDLGFITSMFILVNGEKIPVQFTLDKQTPFMEAYEIKIRISGLDEEDGSGDNWNFRGYMETPRDPQRWIKVNGYFNVRRRNGFLKVPFFK